ncbi:MAG: SDR family oxidoreductase [Bacteroidota bacterium]
MTTKIGVIGCGWLGFPLAESLLNSGYVVRGTTTNTEKLEALAEAGIRPFQIALTEEGIQGNIEDFLEGLEVLVINVPPKLRRQPHANYVGKMKHLHTAMQKAKVPHAIFVSSTSVYGNHPNDITEETKPAPVTESGKQLLETEQLFLDAENSKNTVVRFGGLIGPKRHPVTMLSQKKGLKNGTAPVNLIHLEDCIAMLKTIISENYWGEIFNGVFPYHPTKQEYYQNEAQKRGIEAPEYLASTEEMPKGRIVSKNYLLKGHTYLTPIDS